MSSFVARSRMLGFAIAIAIFLHLIVAGLVSSTVPHLPASSPSKSPIRFRLKASPSTRNDPVPEAPVRPSAAASPLPQGKTDRVTGAKPGPSPAAEKAIGASVPEAPKTKAGAQTEEGSSKDASEFSQRSLAQQISEVSRELVQARQQEMQRHRIVYLQDVKTGKAQASAYEVAWQEKVEHVGNLNFPEEARQKKLSGSLVMAVGIQGDGTVYSIQVIKSSGQSELDEGARHIIQLAAPFAPLPLEVRGTLDVLVITRTWRFDSDYRFGGSPR